MFVITGANGFIGSALVRKVNQEDPSAQVVCVDSVSIRERPEPLKGSRYAHFIQTNQLFDFLDARPGEINCVFHMGACTDTTERDLAFLYENNTHYTRKLFLWCRKKRIPFLYASSAAIYGDGEKGFNDNQNPQVYTALNPYGKSKLDFDQWVFSQKDDPARWYGLRFFNVFGYGESHKGAMASLVYKAFHQIHETNRLRLFRSHNPSYADGKQMRDFVYIKDITRWMWEIYKNTRMASGIYNMGFGVARTWLDLAAAVFAGLNKAVQIDWIDMPENIRGQYQYFTEANMNKARSGGLSPPKWPLEKAVIDYIEELSN